MFLDFHRIFRTYPDNVLLPCQSGEESDPVRAAGQQVKPSKASKRRLAAKNKAAADLSDNEEEPLPASASTKKRKAGKSNPKEPKPKRQAKSSSEAATSDVDMEEPEDDDDIQSDNPEEYYRKLSAMAKADREASNPSQLCTSSTLLMLFVWLNPQKPSRNRKQDATNDIRTVFTPDSRRGKGHWCEVCMYVHFDLAILKTFANGSICLIVRRTAAERKKICGSPEEDRLCDPTSLAIGEWPGRSRILNIASYILHVGQNNTGTSTQNAAPSKVSKPTLARSQKRTHPSVRL